jgi:hypothetical protein
MNFRTPVGCRLYASAHHSAGNYKPAQSSTIVDFASRDKAVGNRWEEIESPISLGGDGPIKSPTQK